MVRPNKVGRPKKVGRVKEIEERVESAARKTATFLGEVLEAKKPPIDIQEMAAEFHRQVGGTTGFVEMVLEEYNGTRRGSLARSRIMEVMVKLFQNASPKERLDLDLLSDEDLATVLKEEMKKTGHVEAIMSPAFVWDSMV